MSYFPPYSHCKNKIDVELDLSHYATKSDLKIATRVATSQFVNLDDLSEVDKLDIDKLEKLPSGLCSLKSKIGKLGIGKLETTVAG